MKPTPNHETESPANSSEEAGDRTEGRLVRFGRWIVSHPKTVLSLALLLFLAILALTANQFAESRLTRMIAAIKAKGEPVTVEDLAEAMPQIPDSENMAVQLACYSDPFSGIHWEDNWDKLIPVIGMAAPLPTGCRLSPEQFNASKSLLSKADKNLQGIHTALMLTSATEKIAWVSPMIAVRLSNLSAVRSAARALALEAIIAAQEGKATQAGEILLDDFHVTDGLETSPFLISFLVRISIIDLACDQTERTINLCGLSDPSLVRLSTKLESLEATLGNEFRKAMMCERVSLLDTAKCLRNGKLSASGLVSSYSGTTSDVIFLWKYAPVFPALDTVEGLKFYNTALAAMGKANGQACRDVLALENSMGNMPWYAACTRLMVPSLSRSTCLWVQCIAKLRSLRTAIAAERFRMANHRWPKNLEELVPKYLPAVPIDPFGGKPIRYKFIPEGIMVYSLDENEKDDGGDLRRLSNLGKRSTSSLDAGWVLVNPDLRGRPAPADPQKTTTQTAH